MKYKETILTVAMIQLVFAPQKAILIEMVNIIFNKFKIIQKQ